ncbi:uncharacterized protein E0L32_012190 [Thyridium curvatum]|uniref:Nuclear speckle splicing regulatory protein 1 N-terminal domain-containing protein n=1 Tax=Thyridium curvatum TaxID=1093900 RepID=A0A507B2I3_9PEZI|nr:uncharacterized protein E0L32_012190 [Thyridium curvatum]TPX17335.1 hypothetical protein E0L32_012190 [Thyridium curvatum]
MNKGLSYGLNVKKKPGSKPGPPNRKPVFGDDDGSDDDAQNPGAQEEEITELDDFPIGASDASRQKKQGLGKPRPGGPPSQPPKSKHKAQALGDLSSALSSRKYAEEAEKLDPSIYDYDASYDSFKPVKRAAKADPDRKPQYMSNLKKMAEVRERDRKIAEDKKMQRDREAEGDEYADKEKFVTEAYKKQQEENRRLEEEERRREEEEAKNNRSGGMTGFYKQLLDRGDERHAEIMKAAEDRQKDGPTEGDGTADDDADDGKKEAEMAREINDKGGSVAINEEGQVVDKRQLLKSGLNVGAKKKAEVQREASRDAGRTGPRDGSQGVFSGSKQAMRDRQSRMLEAQYEQALKRSRVEEEAERQKVELASKSRKTESEISSAKERYLARKRAEAEAKKNGLAEGP